MPWTCRLITAKHKTTRGGTGKRKWSARIVVDEATGKAPVVGDMYFAPWALKQNSADSWAPHYLARPEPRRPPLFVMMPGHRVLCVDQRYFNKDGWYGSGWTLSGEAPKITLVPSINLGGAYHGYITAGVITDDCEGRKYGPDGSLL